MGGLLATLIAFAPSFAFVLSAVATSIRSVPTSWSKPSSAGAGPAVIGAIAGSAVPLGLALGHLWQIPVLAGELLWLAAARRAVVSGLLLAAAVGVLVSVSGVPS